MESIFEVADVLVCDPLMDSRTATRLILQGCRNLDSVANLKDLAQALEKNPPDVAICDAQAGAEDLCALIRRLRGGDPRFNPFTIVIVTAWHTDGAQTAAISNAGADSLLLRPFSSAALIERIEAHVFRRKRWVIAASYIGPERRTGAERPSEAVIFDAPNSLKTKAETRGLPEDAARKVAHELARGRALLEREKSRYFAMSDPGV